MLFSWEDVFLNIFANASKKVIEILSSLLGPQKTRRLAGQSRRTKLSIQLIHQKNLLLAQIKSSSLPDQQVALTHLLINVKCRIWSLRKGEKMRKRRWLIKKGQKRFQSKPLQSR